MVGHGQRLDTPFCARSAATPLGVLDRLKLDFGAFDRFALRIQNAAGQFVSCAQASQVLLFEGDLQHAVTRIDLGDKLRLVFRSGNQQAERERGIQRLDSELSLSTRPGALAAIRVAGGSERADAYLRASGVDEDAGSLERSALLGEHATVQVRVS